MQLLICPTPDEMSEYILGRLTESQGEQIESHLRGCASCSEAIREIESSGDWLVRHARLTPGVSDADPDWNRCVNRLKSIPVSSREPESERSGESESPVKQNSLYHYQLGELLGRGGMGVVYRSEHPQLHRPVAIKILSAARATDGTSVARFQREMRMAGALDHAGIVRALDAGVWQGTYYLVMELVEGIDLSRICAGYGPLAVADACEIIRQAAEALQYAHQQQVIHRDVKPSNMILTEQGMVKLLDFGLARFESGGIHSHDASTAGGVLGTLEYIAPEQATGQVSVDAPADVYGLGATMFRLLAGVPPHGSREGRPVLQFLHDLASQDPPSIRTYRHDLPDGLAALIDEMLNRDAQQRPAPASVVAQRLLPYCQGSRLEQLVSETRQMDEPQQGEDLETRRPKLAGNQDVAWGRPESIASAPTRTTASAGGARALIAGLLLTLLLGFAGGWYGVTLWIQSGDATLTVESEVEDVSLQLIKDGKVAQEIQVQNGAQESIVRVGKYELRVGESSDRVEIGQDRITLMRGDEKVVRIRRGQPSPTENQGPYQFNPGLQALNLELAESMIRIETLRSKLGEQHPELVEARRDHETKLRAFLAAINGRHPDERTSRGRTYLEWSDIVLRETDPDTIVDGVRSLVDLTDRARVRETIDTLIRLARWNESRGSKQIAEDYIALLSTHQESHSGWQQAYPAVDGSWKRVCDILIDALKALADRDDAEALLTDFPAGETADRMRLLFLSRHPKAMDAEQEQWFRDQFENKGSASVLALANFVWLSMLDKPALQSHRRDLTEGEMQVQKAVCLALLNEGRYPFGSELGQALAQITIEYPQGMGRFVLEVAKACSADSSKRLQQEREFLTASGRELLRQWQLAEPGIRQLPGDDIIQILLAGGFLDVETSQSAATFIQGYLGRQLETRNASQNPQLFDERTPWIANTASLLVLLDSPLPETLRDYKMSTQQQARFDQWVDDLGDQSPSADREAPIWMLQYPIESLPVLFHEMAEPLKNYDPRLAQLPPEFRARAQPRSSLSMDYIDPALAIDFAVRNIENEDVVRVMPTLLVRAAQRDEFSTRFHPLIESNADALLKLIEDSYDPNHGLMLHWLQQANADESRVREIALERCLATYESNGKTRLRAGMEELGWMIQCLSSLKDSQLISSQADALTERLLDTSFQGPGSQLDHLVRCFTGVIAINRDLDNHSESAVRLLVAAMGRVSAMRFSGANGRRAPEDRGRYERLRMIAGGMPTEVVVAALEAIVDSPPANQEILDLLRDRQRSLTGLGGPPDDSIGLFEQAVGVVEKALAGSASNSREDQSK